MRVLLSVDPMKSFLVGVADAELVGGSGNASHTSSSAV